MTRGIGTLDYAGASPRVRFGRGLFGWILFIGLGIMLIALFQMKGKPYAPLSYSLFMSEVNKGNVRNVSLSETEVCGEFVTPVTFTTSSVASSVTRYFRCQLPAGLWNNLSFLDRMTSAGAQVNFDNNQNVILNMLIPFVPWLLIFGFIWFFVLRQLRNTAAIRAATASPTAVAPAVVQEGQG
jgi:ATP-dependent Zn protease